MVAADAAEPPCRIRYLMKAKLPAGWLAASDMGM